MSTVFPQTYVDDVGYIVLVAVEDNKMKRHRLSINEAMSLRDKITTSIDESWCNGMKELRDDNKALEDGLEYARIERDEAYKTMKGVNHG
jgi:hypothetical protein